LLLRHGASAADVDANGKTVAAAASSDWIRQLLDPAGPVVIRQTGGRKPRTRADTKA